MSPERISVPKNPSKRELEVVDLNAKGFLTITSRKCAEGCGAEVSPEDAWWMMVHWVHQTHCSICKKPVAIRLTFQHGGSHKCWTVIETYPNGHEVQHGNSVYLVHERCWRTIMGPKDALRAEWEKGVRVAAEIASAYDGLYSHRSRMSDIILAKLDLISFDKVRRNPSRRGRG